MHRRIALLIIALAMATWPTAQAQVVPKQPRYVPVTLCEISFKNEKPNPNFISVEAEYFNAMPHGLVLTDKRCERNGLEIDFPDTGLDPSVAFIQNHLFQIRHATGTFRGILKRNRATGRLYLWLQSVANFQPSEPLPEPFQDEPIRLPESPPPSWPKSP